MKPMRGLSNMRLGNIPKERRTALISIAVLFAFLAGLMVYQRYLTSRSLGTQPAEGRNKVQRAGTAAGTASKPESGSATAGAADNAERAAAVLPLLKELSHPLQGNPQVAEPFIFMYSDVYKDFRQHAGIDYRAAKGQPVLAAGPGKVAAIDVDPADGRVLILDHGHGLTTRYAGLGKTLVEANESVKAGTPIAEIGEPGLAEASLGSHLHFEVLQGQVAVDPSTYLSH